MSFASRGPRWNANAMRHSTSELWVMVTLAADRGIDAERCLMGTLLDVNTLCHRRSRVSFVQQLEVQRRMAQLAPDRLWPLAVGNRLHLTSYGMAGYVLLSSRTLGDALLLSSRFAPLLNLKHELKVKVVGPYAVLSLGAGYPLDDEVGPVCELLELAKLSNLLRDMLGDAFQPREIRLTQATDAALEAAVRSRTGASAVYGGAPQAEIRFDAALIEAPLPQSEPVTCANCIQLCEQQLEESLRFDMTAGRVRALLEHCVDALPGMAEVAGDLCMSPRSLRRRLEAEGTSFHEIVEDIRKDAAERLLLTSRMSTEAIADLLGYGDAANFRHAFKRWTGQSPREYRLARGSSAARSVTALTAPVLFRSTVHGAGATLISPYL